ncbi:MAG TPA: hypothetical protein VIJ25_16595, partial [Methylococcales bacterium]
CSDWLILVFIRNLSNNALFFIDILWGYLRAESGFFVTVCDIDNHQWRNTVQKTGAKIINVTRSALFYFISSRVNCTGVYRYHGWMHR